jgi:ABC-type sugar transport system substrate-binding protein
VGFYSDNADWFGRDPYSIVFIMQMNHVPNAALQAMFEKWAGMLNYKLTVFDSNGDPDRYINTMEVYASQGVDGFLLDADNTFSARVQEVAESLGIPYMPSLLPFFDTEGHFSYPSVGLDNYGFGTLQAQWLSDNYSRFFGADVTWDKVGFITVTFSPVVDFQQRSDGAVDYYKEHFPDLAATNILVSDCASGNMNAETAFDNVGAVVAANSNKFSYWVVQAVTEDFGQGAARALEQMGLTTANAIVNCVGGETLVGEWETGYEGVWVSANYIVQEFLSEGMICGLIALIDGRATPDTLFKEYVLPGEKYGTPIIESKVVEHDTYKAYLDYIAEYFAGHTS